MLPISFSSQHEAVLRKTAITDKTPGLMLHDFQIILDFVASDGLRLTPIHMLPLKVLEPLNAQLARRIEHGLTRPQQKSFPHTNGLYLLLRASGITIVETSGRSPVLIIDPPVGESWRALNADERYFTLLESWLLRGDSTIIGEYGGHFENNNPLRLWIDFFQRFALQSWYNNEIWPERVRYTPALHNLALMELFGLVAVTDAPVEPKKGWQIADVRPTDWGEALLALFASKVADNLEFWNMLAQPQDIPPGILQPYIQPYRPQWKQALQLPDAGFQQGLFVFKVSLDQALWREILIPSNSTLDDLSDAILQAYKFDHDHLYRFLYPTRFGLTAKVWHPTMDEGPFTDEVRIGELPAQPGLQMVYNYDFGDDWNFEVLLERIDPPDPSIRGYRIGKRHGNSPEQYPR